MTAPDHIARNRTFWDEGAPGWVESGERAWAQPEITWGMWEIPEREAGALPGVAGIDAVELGCGTAYFGSWLARRGARVTGLDLSREQLATARTLQERHGLRFRLVLGNAEWPPFAAESFDLAISEYGASIWCDPFRWIPQAARLLRPGGRLVFLKNSVLVMLCVPDADAAAGAALLRPQFGMHRFEWSTDISVEFHLPHGEMIDLLAANGLAVERLIEIQAPAGATTRHTFVTPEWAHRWPSEEIWVARKRGAA